MAAHRPCPAHGGVETVIDYNLISDDPGVNNFILLFFPDGGVF